MPRRKGPEMRVVRLTLPVSAIERFERFAKATDMDLLTAIRICASMQLAQFEATHFKPDLSETPAQREARATTALAELMPEVAQAIVEPEVEPEVKHFQGLRPGPRSDLDEVVESLELLPVRREYSGYMRNL